MEICGIQMNKLFAAAIIIVIILLLSSVFVHISTDLIGKDAVVKQGRATYLLEREHEYR